MKIRVNKKWLYALLTISGISLTTPPASIYAEDNAVKEETGYDDLGMINAIRMDEDEFVILDIGNHKKVGVHYQESKMKYCNKKDISLGVIISSNAEKENDIYDDVEYTKSIIRDNKLDLPVYLDINQIITNDNLNVENKTKLIKTYLEKCSANHIYVGIYGTDKNLCRVKEYCKIADYDAFLVMDSDEIKYDGVYHIYKDLEGNIRKTKDLSTVIETKDLNNADNFVDDSTCILEQVEDITDIALKYGMSVNELLDFNEIKKKDLKAGQAIRIPSLIAQKTNQQYKRLEEPLRGCDLSYAQGNSMNWEELNTNFEFIIAKCNRGLALDPCFENNAKNCNLNNIPMGAYCYNDYDTRNCEDINDFTEKQQAQANFTVEMLKNKKIEYPVYFDIEANVDLKDIFTSDYVKEMLDIWTNTILSAGYTPGLYCNKETFYFLQNCVDYDLADKLELWIAGGEQYSGEKYDIELNQVRPSSYLEDEQINPAMVQSTDSAVHAGAGNEKGHLDIDFSLIDYKDGMMEEQGENEIKDFERRDYKLYGYYALGVALMGTSTTVVVKLKKKKAKQKVR